MRNRFLSLAVVLVATLLFSSIALAQDYDPRDFTGFWDRAAGPDGGSREIYGRGGSPPAMTAWGQEQYDEKRPGYGSRAVPPATGNDPVGRCNPQGIPRILLYPRPSEWVTLDDRLIQVFQWHRVFREVWIDGREIPEDFDPGIRRWLGYSAARWEGNTLVVESAGFEEDQRTWLDHHGNVHSENMRFTERYTRVSEDAIELEMVIDDPMTYPEPWVAEKKTWYRVTSDDLAVEGWPGLMEEYCAPWDEVDTFNRRVRDPAGGVIN